MYRAVLGRDKEKAEIYTDVLFLVLTQYRIKTADTNLIGFDSRQLKAVIYRYFVFSNYELQRRVYIF